MWQREMLWSSGEWATRIFVTHQCAFIRIGEAGVWTENTPGQSQWKLTLALVAG